MSTRCNCRSYNRPDWGGTEPEVVLPAPDFIAGRPGGICVDPCIAEAIQMLWERGIETLGCCCGHNLTRPSVVIASGVSAKEVAILLKTYDGRIWDVMQWKLCTVDTSA